MKQIYLGAPLFNDYQRGVLDVLTELFESLDYTVFSPLEESKSIWNGRAPMQCSPEERRAVVEMNYRGIRESDLMFAWVTGWHPLRSIKENAGPLSDAVESAIKKHAPDLPDTGVAVEIGYAKAIGKPILGYIHDDSPKRAWNLMLSDGTMNGGAFGIDELKTQLVHFNNNGVLLNTFNVESEDESFNG